MVNVGFIGSGRIAERLARILTREISPRAKFCYEKQRLISNFIASDPLEERRRVFNDLGIVTTESNAQVMADSEIVFLTCRDPDPTRLLKTQPLKPHSCSGKIFISLMADVPQTVLQQWMGPNAKILCVKPNFQLLSGGGDDDTGCFGEQIVEGGEEQGMEEKLVKILESVLDFSPGSNSSGGSRSSSTPELITSHMFDFLSPFLSSSEPPQQAYIDDDSSHNAFEDHYEWQEKLGEGSFGEVYAAREKETGQKVAVKYLKRSEMIDSDEKIKSLEECMKAELSALNRLQHPHVIELRGFYSETNSDCMILEYLSGRSLHEYLERQPEKRLPETRVKKLIYQVLSAVEYCHHMDHIHCDIKLENLLFSDQRYDTLKLADFGLSKELEIENDCLKTVCGTVGYLSPEIVRGYRYGKPADIWSTGVVAFMLLYGKAPFYHEDENIMLQQIKHGIVNHPSSEWLGRQDVQISEQAKQFVLSLMTANPENRISAKDALNHPWFRSP